MDRPEPAAPLRRHRASSVVVAIAVSGFVVVGIFDAVSNPGSLTRITGALGVETGSNSASPVAFTPVRSKAPRVTVTGTSKRSCNYILNSDGSLTARFVAQARLHNTGNVTTVDRVSASWVQVGSPQITSVTKVAIRPGHRKIVNFSRTEGYEQISALEAYSGPKICHVSVSINRQTASSP
jgi:hypothetical protein